jgi:hypothetical protein
VFVWGWIFFREEQKVNLAPFAFDPAIEIVGIAGYLTLTLNTHCSLASPFLFVVDALINAPVVEEEM